MGRTLAECGRIAGRLFSSVPGAGRSEILMPERFPPATVEQLKGRRLTFAGQYEQSPAPLGGNLIKRNEVRYYGGIDPMTGQPDETLPTAFDMKIISADCAFKDASTSD